jgi:hypothetical protein
VTRDEIDEVQARIWRGEPDPRPDRLTRWLEATGLAGWAVLAVYLAWRLL